MRIRTVKPEVIIQPIRIQLDGMEYMRFAAMSDGEYCGTVDVMRLEPTIYTFRQLFVIPEFRKQGIGNRLLGECMMTMTLVNGKRLQCEVRKDNLPAIAFYAKRGFQPIGMDGENVEMEWIAL